METAKFVDSSISESIAELLRKCDKRSIVGWAADCAEHVLPLFEQAQPADERPRKAVEAGRAWVRGEITMSEARSAAFAAHAAARDSSQIAACHAARAAGHAAATAHVAGHAMHAAVYAAKAASYASDPADAGEVTERERKWQHEQLLRLLYK